MSWRQRHTTLSLIALVPLVVTVVSAATYRILHSVLGVERGSVRWLIKLHQSGLVFDPVLYTLVVGGLLLALAGTAVVMLLNARAAIVRVSAARSLIVWPPRSIRDWHRAQGVLSAGLLIFAVLTGAGYRFLRNVVGLEKDQIGWLIELHHLNLVDSLHIGSTLYCLAALSLLSTAVISGARMHPKLRSLFPSSASNPNNDSSNL